MPKIRLDYISETVMIPQWGGWVIGAAGNWQKEREPDLVMVCFHSFKDHHWGYRWVWESPWSGTSSSCLAVGRSSRRGQRSRWHPSLAGPELSGSSPLTAPYWNTASKQYTLSHAHKKVTQGTVFTHNTHTQTASTHTHTHLCRIYTLIMAWEVLCLWRNS